MGTVHVVGIIVTSSASTFTTGGGRGRHQINHITIVVGTATAVGVTHTSSFFRFFRIHTETRDCGGQTRGVLIGTKSTVSTGTTTRPRKCRRQLSVTRVPTVPATATATTTTAAAAAAAAAASAATQSLGGCFSKFTAVGGKRVVTSSFSVVRFGFLFAGMGEFLGMLHLVLVRAIKSFWTFLFASFLSFGSFVVAVAVVAAAVAVGTTPTFGTPANRLHVVKKLEVCLKDGLKKVFGETFGVYDDEPKGYTQRKRWSTKSVLCSQVLVVLCLFSLKQTKTGLKLEL